MSRTLQRILLVAAMAGAPLVASASPEEPSFFARIFAKMRAQTAAHQDQPARAAPADQPAHQAKSPPPPSLDRLPQWLKAFFDADDDARNARSTGT